MVNSRTNVFEEYVKSLLICPACSEPIKSAPIHQCANGHVVCKDCITKLEYCPICRNDSTVVRNLVFEQIIENFSTYELASEGPSKKHELQKCEQGSFSKNGPNKGPSVHLNIQPNSENIVSSEHGGSQFEEYIKSLLECPVCIEPIKSTPIHQCTNGHVVCKDCVTKLDNCPICRSDSRVARNVIFEQIIGNFSAFELANEGPFEEPELQKWGQRFVSASFSNNEEPSVQINIPPNSGTMESVEHGGSYNQIISIFKGIKKAAIRFYNFLPTVIGFCAKFVCEGIGYLAIFFAVLLCMISIATICYNVLLELLARVGLDIPEKYFTWK